MVYGIVTGHKLRQHAKARVVGPYEGVAALMKDAAAQGANKVVAVTIEELAGIVANGMHLLKDAAETVAP